MMKKENGPGRTGRSLLKGIKKVFVTADGPRAGWIILCAVVLYRIVSYGLRLGLNADFGKLFAAWRVNETNILMAPRWAQLIWSWHGSIITVVVCAVSLCLSLVMRGWWLKKRRIATGVRQGLAWAGIGAGIAVVSAVLFILTDSVRPEWPLSRPAFSTGLVLMLPVTLFTALTEEMFTKCVVFDLAADRMKRIWAYAVTAIVFFLFNGGVAGTVISGINVLLMGIVCCALYEKYGLGAPVLFRGAWSYGSVFIAGFGASGASGSLYALYGVSENWLTGGDGGMIYGLWMTVILAGMLAWLERGSFEKLKKRIVRK